MERMQTVPMPRSGGGLILLFIGWCVLAGMSAALAAPTPVTIKVSPRAAMPGPPVTIQGMSGIDAPNTASLTIVVTPPQGTPVTLVVPLAKSGEFTTTFKATQAVGRYTVKAISPGGAGQATASFDILPPAQAFEQYDGELAALFPVADQGLQRLVSILDALPESDDKAEAKKRVQTLQDKVKEAKQRANIARITKPLQDALVKSPAAGKLVAPLFEKLTTWEGQSRQERERIFRELDKSSKAEEKCEAIDQAIEAMNLVSAILNLIAAPVTIVANFAQDFFASKLGELKLLVGDAASESFKQALNLTKVDSTVTKTQLANNALGLAFDVSNFLLKGYFGKLCEQLEGPANGTMQGAVTQDGVTYWKFSVGLKGKLVLRYAKDSAGGAIRVRGQFMGFGTDFYVYEDLVKVLFRDRVKANKAVTFHRVISPPINIASDEWAAFLAPQGAIASTLASPTSFYIPLEGDLVKDKLILRIKPARFDFADDLVAAHALYFFWGPTGHEFINQALPYKNGYFIISHAMSAEQSGTVELPVKVDTVGKKTIVSRDFHRDFKNDAGDATATYDLSIKTCNPSCLP